MKDAIDILKRALDKAYRNGAFTLQDSYIITKAMVTLEDEAMKESPVVEKSTQKK